MSLAPDDPPPAPPGLGASYAAPGFGFAEAFGHSVTTWLSLLPRWLPVTLALSLPSTVYAHWLLVQADPLRSAGSVWFTYREVISGALGLVLGVLASALVTSAAVLQRRGERPTIGASLRMGLPVLPRALLLAVWVLLLWGTFFLVAAGWFGPTSGRDKSMPLALLGLALLVFAGHRSVAWGVSLAALLVERGGVFRALERSRALTAGRRLALFCAWLLMMGLFYALDEVLGRTLLAAPEVESSWTEHARAAQQTWVLRGLWVQMVSGGLFTSFFSVSIGVCYVGLRRRREGAAGVEMAEAFR